MLFCHIDHPSHQFINRSMASSFVTKLIVFVRQFKIRDKTDKTQPRISVFMALALAAVTTSFSSAAPPQPAHVFLVTNSVLWATRSRPTRLPSKRLSTLVPWPAVVWSSFPSLHKSRSAALKSSRTPSCISRRSGVLAPAPNIPIFGSGPLPCRFRPKTPTSKDRRHDHG